MNNKELISIIVPIYNVEKYLRKCIESLINQTYKDIEIILIDDGSPDNCGQICDEYVKNDNRIRVVHKKNAGVSEARNDGIKLSKGDYIAFVDSDDYVEKNFIEILYDNAIKNNADVSICNYFLENKNRKIRKKIDSDIAKDLESEDFCKYIIRKNSFRGLLLNKLFKREIFFENGKINLIDSNIHICEDLLFLVENSSKYDKIYFDKESYLYHYVIRENSAISSKYNEKKVTMIYAYDRILNFIEKNYHNLLDDYKKDYLKMALNQKELYISSNFRDEEIKKVIDKSIKKYYKEVKHKANLKEKIYYTIYYRFCWSIILLKKVYHKIKKI